MARTKSKVTRKSPKEREKEVLRHLGHKPMTSTQLAKKMSMTPSGVTPALERLIEAGRIEYSGNGGKGDPYVYSIKVSTMPAAPSKSQKTGRLPQTEKDATLIIHPDTTKTTKHGAVVQTRSVKARAAMENTMALGAASLLVRTVEQKGHVTLTQDSPLFKMLQGSVDFHIKHTDEA